MEPVVPEIDLGELHIAQFETNFPQSEVDASRKLFLSRYGSWEAVNGQIEAGDRVETVWRTHARNSK